MMVRRILFKAEHVMLPATYEAMRRDGVLNWVLHGKEIAEISDNVADDFYELRRYFEDNRLSYRFHSIDTLGRGVAIGLHCAYGFTTRSDSGISDESIKTLQEAKA